MKKVVLPIFLTLLSLALVVKQGHSQVSINTANFVYTQNFNAFAGTAMTPIAPWTAGGTFTFRGVGNGTSNTGGSWAYGTGTDRALGYLGSGTSSSINYNISFTNNTGNPITKLEVSYDFEQWRFESGNNLGWAVTGTGALAAVSVAGLSTNSVNSGVSGNVQVTPKSIILSGLNLAPNATFGFRWSCSNGAGNDNGIAIDNFRLAVICTPISVSVDTAVCSGASFVVDGNSYTTPQIVTDTLVSVNGCDSIVHYNLSFLPAITHAFADTICSGANYNWAGQLLTSGGIYIETFSSAANCDSTVTLSLFQRPAITYSFADTICAATTYTWGGQNYTASGTYNQIFPSVAGCDSTVTLHLFVRPAITHSFADTICAASTYNWGSQNLTTSGIYNQIFTSATNCDSVVTLNLFVRPAITHAFADTVCAAGTYTWGSQTLTSSGTYSQTFTSITNCDSAVTLNLFVRPAITHTFADTICAAATYNWGNQSPATSGSYNQTFISATNCDSVVTLNLFVRPAITHAFADTVCAAVTYNWGTQSHTTTGIYNQAFISATNCDSIVTLNLFVRPAVTHAFADTVCAAATYAWGSQSLTSSGMYTQNFTSATNCDSTVTLNLFVRPAITHAFADTICAAATYTWGGQTYSASGIYNHTFTAVTNCDSLVTLNLFVRPAITHAFADTICAATTYAWAGQNFTISGTYNHTFTSITNCDSVVTLNLFVRPAITHTFADTICAAATYPWGGQSLTTTGSYNQTFTSTTNCDSVVTLNLFVRPAITYTFADSICAATTYHWGSQNLTATGAYNQAFTSVTGCDSTVTLNLFVRPVNSAISSQSVCSGTSYTFGSQVLTVSGIYTEAFTDIHGCDSNVTLTFNVGSLITNSFADTVCNGATYNWGSQSFTATGVYSQTFLSAAGCDSVGTLNLFVRPAITHTFADTSCAGAVYNWGSQTITTTGAYSQTFTAVTNCDSVVTLNLFVRPSITYAFADTICAAGTYSWGTQTLTASGLYNQVFTSLTNCDSTVTLNLFVRPAITHVFADTICAASNYTWGSQTLTATGTYSQFFTSATGCDSTVTLNLFVRPVNNASGTQSICAGTSYIFGTQTLTVSGVYTEVFPDVHGCDSTVTLTLNVNAVVSNSIADTVCFGTTYNWGSQTLTASGSYTQTFTSAAACDSIVTLNFTVSPLITDTLNETLCFGQTLAFGSQLLSTSGTYSQVLPAANGCDSLVVLHLLVHPLISDTIQAFICYGGSYIVGGTSLSTSGYHVAVFPAANGCDSIVTVNLQVGAQPVTVTIDTAACGMVWFEGTPYTTNTILSDTFFTTLGCDSVYRIINITPHANSAVLQTIDTAHCGPLVFEGNLYNESTSFSDTLRNVLGCDSVIRMVNIKIGNAETRTVVYEMCAGNSYSFNGEQYTVAGAYPHTFKNQAGCDSVIVLDIRVNPLPEVEILKEYQNSYCVSDPIHLQASGAQTYTWIHEDVDTLEGDEIRTTLFSYKNAFILTGTDGNGCSNTASLRIDAQACCNIWMPNAFSPNGDGVNDVFRPEAKGHPKEYVLSIFNRWGQTVFSSFDIGKGWDGNINGKPADIADYYYRISGKCVNGEIINLKGVCTLVR